MNFIVKSCCLFTSLGSSGRFFALTRPDNYSLELTALCSVLPYRMLRDLETKLYDVSG